MASLDLDKRRYSNQLTLLLIGSLTRYVLHRLFVQRHAMYIKVPGSSQDECRGLSSVMCKHGQGLEASGMNWKNMTTSEVSRRERERERESQRALLWTHCSPLKPKTSPF